MGVKEGRKGGEGEQEGEGNQNVDAGGRGENEGGKSRKRWKRHEKRSICRGGR